MFPEYPIGTIGFTYVPGLISASVAYAERWHRALLPAVTHTFVVTGPEELIEAHWATGVACAPLAKYLRDPHCRVFFRTPKNLTPELGARIAATAGAQLGCRYNKPLILAAAAADTWLGYWLNRCLGSWPNRIITAWLDQRQHWICSQLVAYALDQQPEFHHQGVLSAPLDTIDPQELFADDILFTNTVAAPAPAANQLLPAHD